MNHKNYEKEHKNVRKGQSRYSIRPVFFGWVLHFLFFFFDELSGHFDGFLFVTYGDCSPSVKWAWPIVGLNFCFVSSLLESIVNGWLTISCDELCFRTEEPKKRAFFLSRSVGAGGPIIATVLFVFRSFLYSFSFFFFFFFFFLYLVFQFQFSFRWRCQCVGRTIFDATQGRTGVRLAAKVDQWLSLLSSRTKSAITGSVLAKNLRHLWPHLFLLFFFVCLFFLLA